MKFYCVAQGIVESNTNSFPSEKSYYPNDFYFTVNFCDAVKYYDSVADDVRSLQATRNHYIINTYDFDFVVLYVIDIADDEAYEFVEALNCGDIKKMVDLFFNSIFNGVNLKFDCNQPYQD